MPYSKNKKKEKKNRRKHPKSERSAAPFGLIELEELICIAPFIIKCISFIPGVLFLAYIMYLVFASLLT